MKRLLLFGGLLLCGGCGMGGASYSHAKMDADRENALRIYYADAERAKGELKAFKEGLAYPGSVK